MKLKLQEQQYNKKYGYFFDPFTLKSYGFSWSNSIHLCSVAIAPDPSVKNIYTHKIGIWQLYATVDSQIYTQFS